MSWGKTQEKLEFFKKLKKKRENPKKGKQTLLYRWQFEKYPKITVDDTKVRKVPKDGYFCQIEIAKKSEKVGISKFLGLIKSCAKN